MGTHLFGLRHPPRNDLRFEVFSFCYFTFHQRGCLLHNPLSHYLSANSNAFTMLSESYYGYLQCL